MGGNATWHCSWDSKLECRPLVRTKTIVILDNIKSVNICHILNSCITLGTPSSNYHCIWEMILSQIMKMSQGLQRAKGKMLTAPFSIEFKLRLTCMLHTRVICMYKCGGNINHHFIGCVYSGEECSLHFCMCWCFCTLSKFCLLFFLFICLIWNHFIYLYIKHIVLPYLIDVISTLSLLHRRFDTPETIHWSIRTGTGDLNLIWNYYEENTDITIYSHITYSSNRPSIWMCSDPPPPPPPPHTHTHTHTTHPH